MRFYYGSRHRGAAGARIQGELHWNRRFSVNHELAIDLRIIAPPQSKRDRLGLSGIMVGCRIMQGEQLLFIVDLHHEILDDVVPDIAVDATSDQGPEPRHRDTCSGSGRGGDSLGKLELKFFNLSCTKRSRAGAGACVVPLVWIPISAASSEATMELKEPVSSSKANGPFPLTRIGK